MRLQEKAVAVHARGCRVNSFLWLQLSPKTPAGNVQAKKASQCLKHAAVYLLVGMPLLHLTTWKTYMLAQSGSGEDGSDTWSIDCCFCCACSSHFGADAFFSHMF